VTDRSFASAARLLAGRVGLRLDPAIRGRLSRALADEATHRGITVDEYAAMLEADAGALQALLDRVTVQETAWFRDPGQFAAFTGLLPTLPAPLTVWSAGCSNGQEPYSLAMVLDEAGRSDWRIVATDISTRALARTREARYAERELRGLSGARRERYLAPGAGGVFEVVPALRQRVAVQRHNLAADPPPFTPGACSVVFCRNVLIYFGHEDVSAFLSRLGRWLLPGHWLFVGYSESLWQVTSDFRLERLGDAFAYQRVDPAAVSAAPPRPASSRQPPTAARRREAANHGGARPGRADPAARVEPKARRRPAPAAATQASETADVRALLAAGEAASAAGDHTGAAALFRKAAYLDPDQPAAHLQLGLALEAAGDPAAARRAYRAARSALDRSGIAAVEAALEGFSPAEVGRFLDAKLGGAS
jgi:chemotaxis methyl-accepting protein methylase